MFNKNCKQTDLGVRKALAERGVRGSNLKDDKPVGAWKVKPAGAKEDEEDGASTGSVTGTESAQAWSTTISSSSEQGVGLEGRAFSSGSLSSGSFTRQTEQN